MSGVASFIAGKAISHQVSKITKPFSESADGAMKWLDGDDEPNERTTADKAIDMAEQRRSERSKKSDQRRRENAKNADRIRRKYAMGKYKHEEPEFKPGSSTGGEWGCCTIN